MNGRGCVVGCPSRSVPPAGAMGTFPTPGGSQRSRLPAPLPARQQLGCRRGHLLPPRGAVGWRPAALGTLRRRGQPVPEPTRDRASPTGASHWERRDTARGCLRGSGVGGTLRSPAGAEGAPGSSGAQAMGSPQGLGLKRCLDTAVG